MQHITNAVSAATCNRPTLWRMSMTSHLDLSIPDARKASRVSLYDGEIFLPAAMREKAYTPDAIAEQRNALCAFDATYFATSQALHDELDAAEKALL